MQRNGNVRYYDDSINIYDIWLTIKKRKWLIFIITFLSFGFSLTYSFLAPDVYQVSNVMQLCSEKPHKLSINITDIKTKMLLLKDLTRKQRAKALDLGKSVVEDIRDIKISKIEETESLKIQMDTTNPSSGVKMINALVVYANELPFVQKKVERKKKILKENRDDLKKIINNPLSLLNLPDKTIVSELLPSLYSLKTNYNEMTLAIYELEEGGIMNLAGKTLVPDEPYKPRRVRSSLLGLIVGAFIGIFSVIIIECFKRARQEHEAKQVSSLDG